jgi:hypothetical protein
MHGKTSLTLYKSMLIMRNHSLVAHLAPLGYVCYIQGPYTSSSNVKDVSD